MKTHAALRRGYHQTIAKQIAFRTKSKDGKSTFANFADGSSLSSVKISDELSTRLGFSQVVQRISGQTAGKLFETITCDYLAAAFTSLHHLRPGNWKFRTSQTAISNFVQYQHLDEVAQLVKTHQELSVALGHGYIVTPDIVVSREPVDDAEVNARSRLVRPKDEIAKLSLFRSTNQQSSKPRAFLHASISCKWTIRSDRSQNTRTEALNLVRNRKGNLPHVVAVTAEPLPMRIASLALGTGDLDCVYHFALPELREACAATSGAADQLEMLDTMIAGNRLRDISDLPFDLAV